MPRLSAREIGEVVAILGIVLSLVFVGLQLRQNALVSRASAYQDLGIAMAEGWRLRASDRELNDLVYRAGSADPDDWSNLTDSDIRRVRAFVLSTLRIYQSAYLEVQEGLLRPEALEDLGIDGFKDTRLLQNMWPFVRGGLSVEFADYLASGLDLPAG
jgi:hypothetical protein